MKNIKLLIILIVILSANALSIVLFYETFFNKDNLTNSTFKSVVLGKTEYGNVIRYGPYGNVSSTNRIVYIVGVHPLENQSHQAIIESVTNQNSTLKCFYHIYQVNVSQDPDDYEKGRSNGQLLAYKYVVPDIKKMSADLVIDVHSNEGKGGYQKIRFLYIPQNLPKTEKLALEIKNQTKWLSIYTPPSPTSPNYVTIPLIKAGIPSMLYETYTYEPYAQSKKQANEIVSIIDKLDFK